MVKWNAGHTKYKFDENALAGHRIMNHALIARQEESQNSGHDGLEGMQDPYKTVHDNQNTYALMITNGKQDNNTQLSNMKDPMTQTSQI